MLTHNNPPLRYDVVVVGARCAGAATAMLLARQGLRVLALDRHRYGSDTLSTHALMRAGVLQLHRWGLLGAIEAAGTPAVRRVSFHYGDEVVAIPIKPDQGIDALYAPRRTVLDRILVDGARAAGAEVRYGYSLTDLLRSADGRVHGVLVRDHSGRLSEIGADRVIGADGMRSTVARLVAADSYRNGAQASASVYGYWSGLDVDGYHWYFRPGVSAGVIPTNGGEACVFASCPTHRFFNEIRHDIGAGFHRVLAETSPALSEALQEARQIGRFRGFGGQIGFFRQSFGPGWALVGDAGYFKDPATAHGITDALRDATLLAHAVAVGSNEALQAYQARRDALSLALFQATDSIASFHWDLETLKAHHRALNEAMKEEVAMLAELAPESTPVRSGRSAFPSRAATRDSRPGLQTGMA